MKEEMHNCNEVQSFLSLYLDDEVDDVGRERVRRHLRGCAECAHLFQEVRAVDGLFRSATLHAPLPGFAERASQAAFDDALRRNLRLGSVVLLMGTVVISSLVLLGYVDLLWTVLAILFAPGFLTNSTLWLGESLAALTVLAQMALTTLGVLREVLVGPLLVPTLLSMLTTVLLTLVLRQSGQVAFQPLS